MNIGPQNDIIMNLILWAVFGLIVGYIVHLLDPRDVKTGILGTMLLGIAGAILGGFLSTAIFHAPIVGFSLQGIVTGVIGGLILAFVSRFFFRKSGHIKTTTTNLQ